MSYFGDSIRALRTLVCLSATILVLASSASHSMELQQRTGESGKTKIIATGKIEKGDAEKVRDFVAALPDKDDLTIYLRSPGGNLHEGLKLGRFFHDAQIRTVAHGKCASSCALAFLGGRDKQGRKAMVLYTTGSLGFHAFRNADGSDESSTDRTQLVVSRVLDYARYVDAPMDLMVKTFSTPSRDIYWLSENELPGIGAKVWDTEAKCLRPCRTGKIAQR